MRYRVSLGLRVVLLVPLIAFLSGAGSATASYATPGTAAAGAAGQIPGTSAFTYVPAPDNTAPVPLKTHEDDQPIGPTPNSPLTTGDFGVGPGETRRVIDQLDVRIPSGAGTETDNKIICTYTDPVTGQPVTVQASSGTDLGNGVPSAWQWNVSLLLTNATRTAEIYSCQIITYARSNDTGVMDVLAPAPGQTTSGTWLAYSSGNEVGAQGWSYPQPPDTCPPDDQAGDCQYIGGGSGRPNSFEVFSGDDWTANADATTFDAVATAQITDCNLKGLSGLLGHTSSCPGSDSGDGIFGMKASEGETWLEVDQLAGPNGPVCAVNRAYSEGGAAGQVQPSDSYYDSDSQHHLPLYFDLSAPVDPLCGGSRLFRFDLHIGWTAGNPVKIDGANVNVIDSAWWWTRAVPPAIGLTQAQADAAIEANGLTTLPLPDYVTSMAPVGTVLAENSPAGTIEPEGSPVQLTLSAGWGNVPDVVGDLVIPAETAISRAGLTFKVEPSVTDCAHKSIVRSQNPPAHAFAAPGSQVQLWITVCDR
jgi:PASTA domain